MENGVDVLHDAADGIGRGRGAAESGTCTESEGRRRRRAWRRRKLVGAGNAGGTERGTFQRDAVSTGTEAQVGGLGAAVLRDGHLDHGHVDGGAVGQAGYKD